VQGIINRNGAIEIFLDFRRLPRILLPLDSLEKLIFNNLSLVGRPISLVTVLGRTVDSLNSVIERRNELIETYKSKSLVPDEKDETLKSYFGFQQKTGHIDVEYNDLIQGMYSQTEDGIFFSQLICKDLYEHGEELVAKFKKSFRKGAPRISKPDFSKAEEAGLMPNIDKYADWSQMFAKRPDNTST
jgi:hypothetical protein